MKGMTASKFSDAICSMAVFFLSGRSIQDLCMTEWEATYSTLTYNERLQMLLRDIPEEVIQFEAEREYSPHHI